MKSKIFMVTVCIALIGCMMVRANDPGMGVTPIPSGKGPDESPSSTSAPDQPKSKGGYFGVDPDDLEAVRRVQQELSHEKFRELFGDDVNIEDFDLSDHPDDSADGAASEKRVSIIERLTKLFELFKPANGKE